MLIYATENVLNSYTIQCKYKRLFVYKVNCAYLQSFKRGVIIVSDSSLVLLSGQVVHLHFIKFKSCRYKSNLRCLYATTLSKTRFTFHLCTFFLGCSTLPSTLSVSMKKTSHPHPTSHHTFGCQFLPQILFPPFLLPLLYFLPFI